MRGAACLRLFAMAVCLWHAGQAAAAAGGSAPCAASGSPARSVADTAGRAVALPREARRIATVGAVPVLNGYLFALGAGDRIVNGLPQRFTASGKWGLHNAVAPYLDGRPVLQGQSAGDVSIERLVGLAPDVVLTMNRLQVRALEKSRAPVVFLQWESTAHVHASMRILACLTDRVPQGEAYLRYFEDTMERVRRKLEGIPPEARPKVLYFNPDSMSTPLQIANWWIAQAGGRSVTANTGSGGNARYSHEQVLAWNPDILIVNTPRLAQAVYEDERFSRIDAVRNGRVHVTPMGVHSWGQRTVEQPLTVLWAARTFHPALFAEIDLKDEIQRFYRNFFNYELSGDETRMVLEGRP